MLRQCGLPSAWLLRAPLVHAPVPLTCAGWLGDLVWQDLALLHRMGSFGAGGLPSAMLDIRVTWSPGP